MHPLSTRNEFLRLRRSGLSFARIGRQLGVSKQTLIAWNRQCHDAIQTALTEDQKCVARDLAVSSNQELADLTRKLDVLRQELASRTLREVPTAHLETLAGEFRQRIEHLQSCTTRPVSAQQSINPLIQQSNRHPESRIQNPASLNDNEIKEA